MDSQGINTLGNGFVVGMGLNFVVLHHTGIELPHFDLMLEIKGHEKLLTWRITSDPAGWQEEDVPAERIADHRKDYLTYEGEISNHRGTVKRVRQGTARILRTAPEKIRLWLEGNAQCAVDLPL